MASAIGTAYVDVKFDDAQVRGQMRKLGGEIEQGTAGLKGVGAEGKKQMGEVEKSTKKVGGVFSSLGKSLKGAAGLFGVSLGAAAVVEGFKGAVDAASNLNEQVNKTQVVFGRNGKQVVAWSKNLEQSFGVSQRAALESAGVFGNMLRPMGLSSKQAANMSKRMVELGGDMASFNNASPEETLDALRSGLAGETEPLRRFGVFLSAARVQSEALRLGLAKTVVDETKVKASRAALADATAAQAEALKKHGKSSDEFRKAQLAVEVAQDRVNKAVKGSAPTLTAAQKAQATYSLIVHDTAAAQGDFERTSTGVANQQRILAARWEDLQAQIGKFFLPVVQKAQQALIDIMGWLSNSGGEVDKLRRAFDGGSSAGKTIRAVVQNLQQAFAAIRPVIANVKQIVLDLMPVWKTMATIALAELKTLSVVIKGLATTVGGVVKIIRGLLEGDWGMVWAGAKQAVSGLVTAVKGILDGLKTYLGAVIGAYKTIAKAIGQAIIDGIVAALKAGAGLVRQAVIGLRNAVTAAAAGAAKWLYASGANIINGLVGGIASTFGKVHAKIAGLQAAVTGAASGAGTWLYGVGQDVVYGFVRGVSSVWQSAVNKVTGLYNALPSAVRKVLGALSPSRVFAAIGVDTVHGFVNGIKITTPDAVQAVRDMTQNVIDAAREDLGSASSRLQSLLSQAFGAEQAAEQTPAEKRLQELQDAHEEAARQQALADAQAAKDAAQTADEITAADQQLADARYAIRVAALQKTADAERTELNKQQTWRQIQFQDDLNSLQTYLNSAQATTQGAQDRIAQIQRDYGITLGEIGATLGKSFAAGVDSTATEVANAAQRLSDVTAEAILKVQAAQELLRLWKRKHPGGKTTARSSRAAVAGLAAPASAAGLAAPLAGSSGASGGVSGLPPVGFHLRKILADTQPEAAPPPVVGVRVFIGEQELRTLVRTEVSAADTQTAALVLAGVR